MYQFSPFCYPKVKENKMKAWKLHVLTTHTVCKHCWLICYETDMGPEIPTAAADQNFAWICKQHQDLIGSVLSFRTKIIWSGPEFGLVRCGYLNAAIKLSFPKKMFHTERWSCHTAIKDPTENCILLEFSVPRPSFRTVYCKPEPQHEKTNKVTMRPAKTQIS